MVTRSRLTSTEAAASSERSPPRSASQWPRPRPRSQFPILIPILTLQPRIPWKSRFVSMVFLLALATVVFIVTGLRIRIRIYGKFQYAEMHIIWKIFQILFTIFNGRNKCLRRLHFFNYVNKSRKLHKNVQSKSGLLKSTYRDRIWGEKCVEFIELLISIYV